MATNSEIEVTGENDPGSMWNNSQTRRSFLKRTGTVGAATILTWQGLSIKSWAETTGGGTGGSSGKKKPLWWVIKEKAAGSTVWVPQGSNLSFAEAVKQAIKIMDDNYPGTEVDRHEDHGGKEVKPARYSAETGTPTDGGSTGHLRRIDFPSAFRYRITERE